MIAYRRARGQRATDVVMERTLHCARSARPDPRYDPPRMEWAERHEAHRERETAEATGEPVGLTRPDWWIDHLDELLDGLTYAALHDVAPDGSLSSTTTAVRPTGIFSDWGTAGSADHMSELVESGKAVSIYRPGWWLAHPDELVAALREAAGR
jgi:hypothetical protein